MRSSLLVLVLAAGVASAATPDDVLRLAPGPYNTVTVVNVAAILRTPRAKTEKWAEKDHTEFLAGALPFHPSATSVVATADFRPGRKDGSGHGAIVVPLNKGVDLAAVAKAVHGEQTTAGGEPVVKTPGGLYLLKLGDDLLGGMQADGKLDVSRWAKAVREKAPSSASRYLARAVAAMGTNHFLIAVDVEDLYDAKDVAAALMLSPELATDEKTRDAVARYLTGLAGVRLVVNVADSALQLAIHLDGPAKPAVKPEVLKAVLVEMIERAGAGLTDLRTATPTVEGERFTLSLNITDDELAGLAAVVLPPAPPSGELDKIPVAAGTVTTAATNRYLQSVDRVVGDLKKKAKRADDYFTTANWHDAAANRLMSLSVIGVDPKAVEYAGGTATVLQEIGESLRGVPIEANRIEQGAYYYQSGGPQYVWRWGHGWHFVPPWYRNSGTVVTNLPEVRAKQTEVILKDRDSRDKLWKLIDAKRTELTASLGKSK